jgi:hypothetical protein
VAWIAVPFHLHYPGLWSGWQITETRSLECEVRHGRVPSHWLSLERRIALCIALAGDTGYFFVYLISSSHDDPEVDSRNDSCENGDRRESVVYYYTEKIIIITSTSVDERRDERILYCIGLELFPASWLLDL